MNASATLKPGRYVVRGGPRGDTATCRVMRDLGDGRVLHNGRTMAHSSYTRGWPVLAAFRVRRGQHVTHYGALNAAALEGRPADPSRGMAP